MKRLLLIIIAVNLVSANSYGKIWTVDNTGKVADFNNLAAAYSAAAAGDTLLLGGGGGVYSDLTLTKKLVIIGTGYFLTENPNTIENKGTTTIYNVSFQSGSDGSHLVGVTSRRITIATDNVTVRRCIIDYSSSLHNFTISGNNNTVKQCYMMNFTSSSSYILLYITGTNNTVRNCYLQRHVSYVALNCGPSNIIENNVFAGGNITINSSSFGNNIMTTSSATFNSCDPYHSIGSANQFGSENGNQSYVTMSGVFVSSGTTDGRLQLSSSSPAKGAGLGGVDCGMFGGNDPYVLSGIAEIPVITSITVPGRASLLNGLNVKLTIRSNN